MSHYVQKCKHGVVMAQCRCPAPDKVEVLVPCPSTCAGIIDETCHSELTLFKVRNALDKSGFTMSEADRVINSLLNAGILFRERVPE